MIDVKGCKVAFLTVGDGKNLKHSTFQAMDALTNMGVDHINILRGIEEATTEYVKIQERHGVVPPDQKFLRLTERGEIVNLFA